jgi:FG-GAP repeat
VQKDKPDPFDTSKNTGNIDSRDSLTNVLNFETASGEGSVSASQVSAQSSSEIYGDFNGDGFDDVAIGVPQEDVGSIQDAGAVNVIYGSSSGLSATSARADQFWTQNSADVIDVSEMDDEFGSSLTSGDFNGDGIDDLAIGVPGEDIGSATDAGAVNVIYGSGAGLYALLTPSNQFWTQSTTDVNDVPETFDGFGSSLSSGDFNDDGNEDLAIGVPSENGAGGVNILYGSSSGLSATSTRSDQFWTQSTADVSDVSESGDEFGTALG